MNRIADITLAALALRDRARTAWLKPSRRRPLVAPRQALPPETRVALNLAQLMGRCHRLQQELAIACDAHPLNQTRIHRLMEDLSSTQCDVAALRGIDEDTLGGAAIPPAVK